MLPSIRLPVLTRSIAAALTPCSRPSRLLRSSLPHRPFSTLLTRSQPSPLTLSRSQLHPCTSTSTSTCTALSPTPSQCFLGLAQHPAWTGLQIRGVKRNTFNPSHRVRKRRFGFLARARSKTGRQILVRRRLKGRKSLTH